MKGKKINPEQMKPDKANEREGDMAIFLVRLGDTVTEDAVPLSTGPAIL